MGGKKGREAIKEVMEGGEEEWLRLGEGVEFVEPTKRLQVEYVYSI